MESLFRFIAPPGPCSYLPQETASLEYEMVQALSAQEYMERLLDGWRRFGMMLFRPRCPACTQCRSLRVEVNEFRPNRSQRRTRALCEPLLEFRIQPPAVSREKLHLYDRYHAFQSDFKGWPWHAPKDAAGYRESFVHNPPFTEEWCYHLNGQLVCVSYVDALPGGLSDIYCFYDPDYRHLSLGTWNVLTSIHEAQRRRLPHVYLGYYVEGCPSLQYKANFKPNQIRGPDGLWRPFL